MAVVGIQALSYKKTHHVTFLEFSKSKSSGINLLSLGTRYIVAQTFSYHIRQLSKLRSIMLPQVSSSE
jgi:hypothetical protein